MPFEQTALIVDDDPSAAMMTARVASICGCRAEIEPRPRRAVERALGLDGGLVCVSLSMPGVNGQDVYTLIRSREWALGSSGVAMIAVAERDSYVERARSLTTGFVAHLVKPVRLQSLEPALARVLDLRASLVRNRDSVDRQTIAGHSRRSSVDASTGQTAMTGFDPALGPRATKLIYRAVLAYFENARTDAIASLTRLASMAEAIGAAHLSSLSRDAGAALGGSVEELERRIVLIKSELDRVVFTLRRLSGTPHLSPVESGLLKVLLLHRPW